MTEKRRPPFPLADLPDGLYERVLTHELAASLSTLRERADIEIADGEVHADDLPEVLASVVGAWVRRSLEGVTGSDRRQRAAHLAARVFSLLSELGPEGALDGDADALDPALRQLIGIARAAPPQRPRLPDSPAFAFREAALLTNARDELRAGEVLRREIASADRIHLISAFVIWSGVREIAAALEAFGRRRQRAGQLRVLTSTYMGATEGRALERLEELGAEVKVNYESRTTRLHAKAWIFERDSGEHTALIGSSNLSHSALQQGLEWNVRLSARATPHLLERARAAFASFWEDERFEAFEAERFARARASSAHTGAREDEALPLVSIRPWPFQRRILDRLGAERALHGRHRNLVVAATGTGKTVIAALDYASLCRDGKRPRLLFVAHRKEILHQARGTFRHALQDRGFGEFAFAGERPARWDHVFASVQSLSRRSLDELPPEHFEVVILDEFHHAEARTYRRLLDHLRPTELLGLTATPERADGQSVTHWFDDRFAAELRLWEALDEGLLCPFQYFAVADATDLSGLKWRRGGYEPEDLERYYLGHDRRVGVILEALADRVLAPSRMRAIGFCVSVRHAEFMADRFEKAGLHAASVTGKTPAETRHRLQADLREGRLNILFTVDVLGEGVDLPEVDTVLFLRPTESATVFLQQLGRGLRLHPDKRCLTVLDFIGTPARSFRFLDRFRALIPGTRGEVTKALEHATPPLPPGCHLEFEPDAHRIVLENLKGSIKLSNKALEAEVKAHSDADLQAFIQGLDLEVVEFYKGGRSWTELRRRAGILEQAAPPQEERLARALSRLLHTDDPERFTVWGRVLSASSPPEEQALGERERRIVLGLAWILNGVKDGFESLDKALAVLWRLPELRSEMLQLLDLLRDRVDHLSQPWQHPAATGRAIPLRVHAHYSRDEIMAAFAQATVQRPRSHQAGVLYDRPTRTDLLFITHRKSEREFSPKTLYQDYALSPTLFHWESQHVTRAASRTGMRYREHAAKGSVVLLFARREKKRDQRTQPYCFLGPAHFVSYESERPMRIVWKLEHAIPGELFAAISASA